MFSRLESITECHRVSQSFTLSLPQKHRICLLTQPEVVTMAKKFVTTLKGCNNGKIKLLQRLQVVTMAN